ncbi:hypothetical protein J1N35_014159 [Gossypium stocksii]|uniref:Uncharacterized protein n=1 Tax=Gossypium stocksii TaxID=47602 RepID=A0A9D3VUX3_9ROSI|nr:hypothetical protein J1N35_014159 [Gossypium stocksii]
MDVVASSARAGNSSRKRLRAEMGSSSSTKSSGIRSPPHQPSKKLVFPEGESLALPLVPTASFPSSISPSLEASFEQITKLTKSIFIWETKYQFLETIARELEEKVRQLETHEQQYLSTLEHI